MLHVGQFRQPRGTCQTGGIQASSVSHARHVATAVHISKKVCVPHSAASKKIQTVNNRHSGCTVLLIDLIPTESTFVWNIMPCSLVGI
jgi:hypothetical protein